MLGNGFLRNVFNINDFEIVRTPLSDSYQIFKKVNGVRYSIDFNEFFRSLPYSHSFYDVFFEDRGLKSILDSVNQWEYGVVEGREFSDASILDVRTLENDLLALDVKAKYDEQDGSFEFVFTLYVDKEGIIGIQDRGVSKVDENVDLSWRFLFCDSNFLYPSYRQSSVGKLRTSFRLYPLNENIFFYFFGAPFDRRQSSILNTVRAMPFRIYYLGRSENEKEESFGVLNKNPSTFGFLVPRLGKITIKSLVDKLAVLDEQKNRILELLTSVFVSGVRRQYFLFYNSADNSAILLGTKDGVHTKEFFIEFSLAGDISIKDYAFADSLNLKDKRNSIYANENSIEKLSLLSQSRVVWKDFYNSKIFISKDINFDFLLRNLDEKISNSLYLDCIKTKDGKKYIISLDIEKPRRENRRSFVPTFTTSVYEYSNDEKVVFSPKYKYRGIVLLKDRLDMIHAFKQSLSIVNDSNGCHFECKLHESTDVFTDVLSHTEVFGGDAVLNCKFKDFAPLFYTKSKSYSYGDVSNSLFSFLNESLKNFIFFWLDNFCFNDIESARSKEDDYEL